MSSTSTAEWVERPGAARLTFTAARLRDAYSPRFLAVCTAIALAVGAVSALAGAGAAGSVLAAILSGGLVASLVGFFRLSAQAHPVELEIDVAAGTIAIAEADREPLRIALTNLSRLVIVHDGAPARVALAGPPGQRWTVGQLYRNARPEPHLAPLPESLRDALSAAGCMVREERRRGIRTTTVGGAASLPAAPR